MEKFIWMCVMVFGVVAAVVCFHGNKNDGTEKPTRRFADVWYDEQRMTAYVANHVRYKKG